MTLFGCCVDSLDPNHLTPERIAAYKSIGFADIARLGIWPELMWPDPSKPINFDTTDRQFDMLNNASVIIYANFFGCPAWMSEGKDTYREGLNGCWEFNDPNEPPDWNLGFHQAGTCVPMCWRCEAKPERVDYCLMNIPHINTNALEDFARSFALRYNTHFEYVGAGNEPTAGPGLFWPPSGTGDFDDALARFVNEYVLPIVTAVKEVMPSVRWVFPEADSWDGLRRLMAYSEMPHVKRLAGTPDVIAGHPYPGIFSVDDFMSGVRDFGRGITPWNTEMDPDPAWYEDVLTRYPEIGAHFVYGPDRCIVESKMIPNTLGRQMEAVIAKHREPKRPPVAPPDLAAELSAAFSGIENAVTAARAVALKIEERLSRPVLVEPKMLTAEQEGESK